MVLTMTKPWPNRVRWFGIYDRPNPMIYLMRCNYYTRAAIKILGRTISLDFAKLHYIKKQIKKRSSGSLEMQWIDPTLTHT